jgi:hypothetical protein
MPNEEIEKIQNEVDEFMAEIEAAGGKLMEGEKLKKVAKTPSPPKVKHPAKGKVQDEKFLETLPWIEEPQSEVIAIKPKIFVFNALLVIPQYANVAITVPLTEPTGDEIDQLKIILDAWYQQYGVTGLMLLQKESDSVKVYRLVDGG